MEKIIHQIWVGKYKMPTREQQLVSQVKELNKNCEYMFWTEPDPELPSNLKYWYDKHYAQNDFAFCADILRIWYVYKYGGFYFDVDWNIKNTFDELFEHNGVFFYHNATDYTIPNNIFGARKGCDILKYCMDTVTPSCGWFGPSWFGGVIKKYFDLPYECPHEKVQVELEKKGYKYHLYRKFELEKGKHESLYSWSSENKKIFSANEQL